MSLLEPNIHGVVVCSSDCVVIGPYSISIFKHMIRFGIRSERVVEIAKLDGVVVTAAIFSNNNRLSFRENINGHLINSLSVELIINCELFMFMQVQDNNFVVLGIQGADLILSKYCKGVSVIIEENLM